LNIAFTMQLYIITTVVLTGQTIYYSHIYHHLKEKKSRVINKVIISNFADNPVVIPFLHEHFILLKIIFGKLRQSSY
jgi:hypothetical protein